MNPRNTILKIKGLQEWVAISEGTGIHLTGEKGKAYVWTKEDAELIKRHWGSRYTTPLELIPFKKHKPKRHEQSIESY